MLRRSLMCVKHSGHQLPLALITMLPSAPQPPVEVCPQACALASRPRPSPVGGLLQNLLLAFVLRSPFIWFSIQAAGFATNWCAEHSPSSSPHLSFDLSEADSFRFRILQG